MISGTPRSRRTLLLGAAAAPALAAAPVASAAMAQDTSKKRKGGEPPIAVLTAQYQETNLIPDGPNGTVIIIAYKLRGLDMRLSTPVLLTKSWGIALSPTQLGTAVVSKKLRYEVATAILGRPASQASRVYIEFV